VRGAWLGWLIPYTVLRLAWPLFRVGPGGCRRHKFWRARVKWLKTIYRTDFISPRKNIIFCPAGWLRARKNIYLFWGCGIEKRGFLAYFGACQAKIPVRGWCKLNIFRVQGWCGSVKLKCFFGAADWIQVCTVPLNVWFWPTLAIQACFAWSWWGFLRAWMCSGLINNTPKQSCARSVECAAWWKYALWKRCWNEVRPLSTPLLYKSAGAVKRAARAAWWVRAAWGRRRSFAGWSWCAAYRWCCG